MALCSDFPPIHFFKIIVSESLEQGKLMIPITFVKKYGDSLPTSILIKTPNGADWKINLVKNDGKIWFEKGWKEFADYHSLSHGHLVVFKYEKASYFEVIIFDKSGLEIKYPLKRVEVNKEENCRASQKRKAYSSFEIGSTSCVEVVKSQKVAAVSHTHKKHKGKQENTTLERAKELKTCNPYFVLLMGASYVETRYMLTLPSMFGKTHFDIKKKKGNIYFQVPNNEKVWPARYGIRTSSTGLRFELFCGWKKFSTDNDLKVGDVCNFELVLKTNMTFLVHIFRKTNQVSTDSLQILSKSKEKLLKDR
ncbi:B3 domain-containing protein At3g18960-like [Vicia villosa]|uniref:B3 domain-containing protein At3g18960-like n=1 Tax=Vicia villosa TaxID=3911 RepID=UPI00273C0CA2|nr:B3 domain-containing protein At3g18960-like [Vicia villosa]